MSAGWAKNAAKMSSVLMLCFFRSLIDGGVSMYQCYACFDKDVWLGVCRSG